MGRGVEEQAIAGRAERNGGGEERRGRRRVPGQPGQREPGTEPPRQPPSYPAPQQCGGHRGEHDRRSAHGSEREGRGDGVELRAAAVGADRPRARQRQDGAAPRDPAGRDHGPARGAAVPRDRFGGRGNPHRGEHHAPDQQGIPDPGRHPVRSHDRGHERWTRPPADEEPQTHREHGLDEAEGRQLDHGAALLDEHLPLAAAAYEQGDRGQRDHQPRQSRGEDPHGGHALPGRAQPGPGLDDDRRQPDREGHRVGASILDPLVQVGRRVLHLVAQGVGRGVEPSTGPRSAAGPRPEPRPTSPTNARRSRRPGPGRSWCRRPAAAAAGSWAPSGRARPAAGRSVGATARSGPAARRRRRSRRRRSRWPGPVSARFPAGPAGGRPGRRRPGAAGRRRCRAATGRCCPAPANRPRGPATRGHRSPRRPRRTCVRRCPGSRRTARA